MMIYLDDNRADRRLAGLLAKAGHMVVLPIDVGLSGASDARHLRYTIEQGQVLLTEDRVDFTDLHNLILACGGSHPGILVIRYQNDPKRDMKAKHIVAAIGKLVAAGLSLQNQLVVLNLWR